MTSKKPLLGLDETSLAKKPGWLVLVVMCGVSFTSNVVISLIAPFLPQHFQDIGVSQVWCGAMFSGFPIAMLICSPLAVRAMGRFGRVPALFFGLILQGCTTITFGSADKLSGGPGVRPDSALVIYATSRLLCGAGGAFANNAIFSIAVDRFPDHVAKVMSLNEIVIGMGFSLGPPIGTTMYLVGGFGLPFLTSGLAVLFFAPFALMLAGGSGGTDASASEDTKGSGSLMEVLQPGLIVPAVTLLLGTSVFGVVQPVLSFYLQDHVGVRPQAIGIMFAALAFSYSLAGPGMASVADRLGPLKVCTSGGLAAGLIMVVLLGPAAGVLPTGSFQRIAYMVLVLLLLGVAQAATLIPSLHAMKEGVTLTGPTVTDRVVAWFNMFLQLGLAIAPLVGTSVVGMFGFERGVALCGAGITAYGLFAVRFAWTTTAEAPAPVGRQRSISVTGITISPRASTQLPSPHLAPMNGELSADFAENELPPARV